MSPVHELKHQVTQIRPPLLIAHRGASGYLPEHTIAAYAVAIEQGADIIEIDVVPTRDGRLICRHENNLSVTTNVGSHSQFASRKRQGYRDGLRMVDWWSEDFTLDEIKSLRSREPMPGLRPCSTKLNDNFEVPTVHDILMLLQFKNLIREPHIDDKTKKLKKVGLCIELKNTEYFKSKGINVEDILIREIEKYDYSINVPIFIECLNSDVLNKLKRHTSYSLIQLLDGRTTNLLSDSEKVMSKNLKPFFNKVYDYATAVAPEKSLIIPQKENGYLSEPSAFVDEAHLAGLSVYVWTFRAENQFLPKNFKVGEKLDTFGDLEAEILRFLSTGIDGFFTDHVDIGGRARRRFLR